MQEDQNLGIRKAINEATNDYLYENAWVTRALPMGNALVQVLKSDDYIVLNKHAVESRLRACIHYTV